MNQRWPERLWIVRHGESAGNVARDAAHAAGLGRIDITDRDVDVPLSSLGKEQSQSSRALVCRPACHRASKCDPHLALLASAHHRRADTGGRGRRCETQAPFVDERLREKEFGVLDRLTRTGIEQLHPEQAEFRKLLGKFYHRPPGGESWCDVILRLRSALDTISLHHSGCRVLIVGHQVVVLCMRYLLEGLTEQEILAIDAKGDVANCAVTEYGFDPSLGPHGGLVLHRYNFVAPLEEAGAPITSSPDAKVAAR